MVWRLAEGGESHGVLTVPPGIWNAFRIAKGWRGGYALVCNAASHRHTKDEILRASVKDIGPEILGRITTCRIGGTMLLVMRQATAEKSRGLLGFLASTNRRVEGVCILTNNTQAHDYGSACRPWSALSPWTTRRRLAPSS